MATPSVRSQAASILATLQDRCLLVNVSFHRWTGQPAVQGATVEVPPVVLDSSEIAPPHWKLEPESLKRAIDAIEKAVRSAVARCSMPFLFRGVHLVPMNRAAELFTQLAMLREQLNDTVDRRVVKGYPDLLEEIEERLGPAAFERAEPYIPPAETMSSRYGLEWSACALPGWIRRPPGSGETPFLAEGEERFARRVVELVSKEPAIQEMLRRPAPKPDPEPVTA